MCKPILNQQKRFQGAVTKSACVIFLVRLNTNITTGRSRPEVAWEKAVLKY